MTGHTDSPPEAAIAELCARIAPPHAAAGRLAELRQRTLARPVGSLGRLDSLVRRIAAIRGDADPGPLSAAVSVIAGDHGLARHGVSAFPQRTGARVLGLVASGGAPVNVIAARASAPVVWADFGLSAPVGDQSYKVASGTGDIGSADAMTPAQARRAILNGARYLHERLGAEKMIAVGEIGIGNTAAAAALSARLLDLSPVRVVGSGSGVDRPGLQRKHELIERALARVERRPNDPLTLLAGLGGYEIAGNVGVILAAAADHRVVVLDGFITGVAALLAVRLQPEAACYLVAAHRSAEPGHQPVLDELGLEPLLDLEMRLGMASGAAFALGLLNSTLDVARSTPRARDVGLAGAGGEIR
ncbi:nicotinate-nucleotide--dimethylbenzimidazole phosphoribosyltransferase [Streptomyces sp. NPDC005283]|uniref:nicotinate-nucleotide--dimethylbenzimidazole phosphoribosyltransferase n=1 Tax=Streptomyces sp. NPDC005283 TaxID=3156871 RepID=UPI003452A517